MTTNQSHWADVLIHLSALASRLEGEGQYNLAKLARAAADAMGRQAAYQIAVPVDKDDLAAEIQHAAAALSQLGVDAGLPVALSRGADMMAQGGLPLYDVIPHPYVCRTCGQLTLTEPMANCPTCGAWPDTYQRFMPNYWFDALEPFAAIAQLRQTPLDVEQLLTGLTEVQLNQTPPEGGWAIRNVLTHLRDAQDVLAFRLDLFEQEENPVLEAKAVWTWAATEERPSTAHEIFATYWALRRATVRKLEDLPLAAWWRTGRHAEFGAVTLRQQVSYFAAHEVTHLVQIERLRRQWIASD